MRHRNNWNKVTTLSCVTRWIHCEWLRWGVHGCSGRCRCRTSRYWAFMRHARHIVFSTHVRRCASRMKLMDVTVRSTTGATNRSRTRRARYQTACHSRAEVVWTCRQARSLSIRRTRTLILLTTLSRHWHDRKALLSIPPTRLHLRHRLNALHSLRIRSHGDCNASCGILLI